jgi:hypothetical protein
MTEDEALRRLREAVPFEIPRPDEIEYASPAEVKTFPVGANLFRKWLAVNVDGALMLAGKRLVFVGIRVKEDPAEYGPTKSWEVKTADISHLKRPKWLFGAGLTFDAGAEHYIIGLGLIGGTPGVGSGAARLLGDAAMAGAAVGGLVQAAEGVKMLRAGGSLRDHWFELLSQASEGHPS